MAKQIDINIIETAEELKAMIRLESNAKKNARLRALYLVKTGQVNYKNRLADLLGYNRTSVREWFEKYEEGGIDNLMEIGSSPGRTSHITDEMAQAIQIKIDGGAFDNYQDVVDFIKQKFDVELPYNTLHRFIHYKLGAALKSSKMKTRKFAARKEILTGYFGKQTVATTNVPK
jgi:putative transposase